MVLVGEEGPVTNLDCSSNATYDFSTGLIFKNGNYFDPSTGVWLAMGGMMVYQGGWQPYDGKRRYGKGKKRLVLLFLLLLALILVACGGVEQVDCSGITLDPPPIQPAQKVLLFGGLGPEGLDPEGPDPEDQLPHFHQIATESVGYPGRAAGGKQQEAKNVMGSYEDEDLLIIGYSAGADAALIYADGYMRTHPEDKADGWSITGVALLGPTMTGGMDVGGSLATRWNFIIDDLLMGGTDIYLLDDAAPEDYTPLPDGYSPVGATGEYHYVPRPSQQHYDPTSCCGEATNNSIAVRDEVVSWFNSH